MPGAGMMGLHGPDTSQRDIRVSSRLNTLLSNSANFLCVHCPMFSLAKQSLALDEFSKFLRDSSRRNFHQEMHKFICERWTNIYHMLIHSENLASPIYSELVSEEYCIFLCICNLRTHWREEAGERRGGSGRAGLVC